MKLKNTNKGFTLIEILVVIGIIAVLAAIVIVAINPARQFAQARNTQRESDVSTILNAIGQKSVDCKGTFDASAAACPTSPVCPTITTVKHISSGAGSGTYDLSCLVPTYIASAMPFDPNGGSASDTDYTIEAVANGRYKVCAPNHDEDAIDGSDVYCLTR